MPDFAAYEDFTREIPIALTNGDTLNISYKPAKYSGDFNKRVSDEGGMTDEAFLVEVLHGWDWTSKGKPVAVSVELLSKRVSVSDRGAMVRAIVADIFPNDSMAETTERNGTDSSPSP